MVLRPDQARVLADVLLSGADESEGPESGAPESGLMTGGSPGGVPAVIGRYRITRLVGHGGMGAVYEAQQEHPARRVALKVVRAELVSPELARRLDHEARVLGRLEHPGIARIFEAGNWPSTAGGPPAPYFAMEYVEGKPLTEYVKENKLSLKNRLELFLAVCDAVEHAHRRGIIHRDLKPGNILVDAEGKPRVLDFGLARATDADVRATTIHTEVGQLVGTLPYMSPEQLSGDPDATDTRSDVYALGVVLYEMLAGKPPYQVGRGAIAEAARIILDTEPASLSSVDRVFRGDLDLVAAKALAKERARRYQSVSELGADIRRYLMHEPIEAKAASGWYQLRKLAQRNRAAFFSVSAAVIALAAGTLVSSVLAVRAADARIQSEQAKTLAQNNQRTAETEARHATQVIDFMLEAIAQADVFRAGSDLKASEMIDGASAVIGSRLADHPRVAAPIHAYLAASYLGLGMLEKSHEHATEAIALSDKALDPSHPHWQTAHRIHALVMSERGEYAIADREFAMLRGAAPVPDVEHLVRVLLGHAHVQERMSQLDAAERSVREGIQLAEDQPVLKYEAVELRIRLVSVLGLKGRHDEALQEAEDLLATSTSDLGETNPRTLNVMRRTGDARLFAGLPAQALDMYERTLELQRRVLGPDVPATINTMSSMVLALEDLGRLAEAETVGRQCVEQYTRRLGPEHSSTLGARANLANVLRLNHKIDEAVQVLEQVLEAQRRRWGERHHRTLTTMNSLATALGDAGRKEEALTYAEQVMDLTVELFPPDHPDVLTCRSNLARAAAAAGQVDRALELHKTAVEETARALGEYHTASCLTANGYMDTLIKSRRWPEAEALGVTWLPRFESAFPAGNWHTALFRVGYGVSLGRQGRFEDAEREMIRAIESLSPEQAAAQRNVAIETLIGMYGAWKKPDRAAEWRARLTEPDAPSPGTPE